MKHSKRATIGHIICLLFTSASFSQAATCVPLPDGIVSWWRAEGNALDATGPNNGLLIGGVNFSGGRVGQGFTFSGNGDDYVSLPLNSFPMPSSGVGIAPFSFEVWFKTVGGGVILGQQDVVPFNSPVGGYVPALYVGTNGLLYAKMFWGDGGQLASTVPVNNGVFHHTAIVYDGVRQTLYVDGAFSGTTTLTQQAYSSVYYYQFGTGYTGGWTRAPGGWYPFSGVVDEATLYSRALGSNEVAVLFNAGAAGKCIEMARSLLRHRYSFSELAGNATMLDSATAANGSLLFAASTPPYTNGVADGSALTGSGSLSLAGTNGFVALPRGIVSALSSLTVEAWLTWNSLSTGASQTVFDFGSNDQGAFAAGTATNFITLSAGGGAGGGLQFDAAIAGTAGVASDTNALNLGGAVALTAGTPVFLAVSYDPVDGLSQLYVNGVLVNSLFRPLHPLTQFVDANNWLGRSQTQGGAFFNGRLDELRIWEGALRAEQVLAHFVAGPDQPLPVEPPKLQMARSTIGALLSWRADLSTGLHVEAATGFPPAAWTSVTTGVVFTNHFYQLETHAAGTFGYYRLHR